jgi:hypothetical protein
VNSVSKFHLADFFIGKNTDQGHLESEGRVFATNIFYEYDVFEFSLEISLRFKIYTFQ